jgi:hypothetical protein
LDATRADIAGEAEDKVEVEVKVKDAKKTVASTRKPAQISLNGKPPTADPGIVSFAPEISEERAYEGEDARPKKEAREKPERRSEEPAAQEESKRSYTTRHVEDRLGALGQVETLSEGAAPMAPQPATAIRESPAPKLLRQSKGTARPQTVVCLLTPLEGSESPRSLELPVDVAPPAGAVWRIVVQTDGRARIADDGTGQGAGRRSRVASEDDTLKTEKQAAAPPESFFHDQFFASKDPGRTSLFRDIPAGRYLLRRASAER